VVRCASARDEGQNRSQRDQQADLHENGDVFVLDSHHTSRLHSTGTANVLGVRSTDQIVLEPFVLEEIP
jgi:hypothetical protein